MAEAFQPGATVRLKSGGPRMTVVEYAPVTKWDTANKAYRCRWFDDKNILQENFFTEAELASDD